MPRFLQILTVSLLVTIVLWAVLDCVGWKPLPGTGRLSIEEGKDFTALINHFHDMRKLSLQFTEEPTVVNLALFEDSIDNIRSSINIRPCTGGMSRQHHVL